MYVFLDELKKGVRAEEDFEEPVDSELESLKGLEIGSCLHEDWRKTRLRDDGTYEPRWKKVKDRAQLKFGVELNKKIISGEVKKQDLKEKFKSNDEQII